MDENRYDRVVDGVHDRIARARRMLRDMYKNTRPFRMERKKTPDEMLMEYENMSPEDMYQMMQEKGRHETNQYIMEMEQLKQKKQARLLSLGEQGVI